MAVPTEADIKENAAEVTGPITDASMSDAEKLALELFAYQDGEWNSEWVMFDAAGKETGRMAGEQSFSYIADKYSQLMTLEVPAVNHKSYTVRGYSALEGKIVSMNEGNYNRTSQELRNYIDYTKEIDKATNRPYTARYIGSLVADFHRNLLKGGVYVYPSTDTAPAGKLRLLYECNPLAFVIEQAGGKAIDVKNNRILEIEATELHQRTPIYMGSQNMVDRVEEIITANSKVMA